MKHNTKPSPGSLAALFRSSCLFAFLSAGVTQAQTYFDLSSGDFSENFADISSTTIWPSPSTGSWSGMAAGGTGTIPTPTNVTVASTAFATGSGVQRGTGNIQLLSSGTTDNTSSTALNLNLNFSNRDAGTLSFNAATVFNSTGNRVGTLRVYYTTNGTSWSELTGGGLPYAATNNVAGSQAVSVALPTDINDQAQVTFRFYYHNGSGGTTGSRPKISVDDVSVTSTLLNPNAPAITSFTPTTGWGGTAVTITGANFNGATAVAFNSQSAASFTVNSATEISATAPAGVTTGKISVTTPEGLTISADNFTAVNPNTLSVAVTLSPIAENATNPATTGTITRSGPLTSLPLTVTLTSSDTTEITVPATVEFSANQTIATFDITAQNDTIPDGTQTVTITATSAGYIQSSTTIDVTDDGTDTWPLVINQYYEGVSNDKYIEIKNISAAPVQLSEYRLASWNNTARLNWKTNTGTADNTLVFSAFSLPAGATYLIKNSSASNPTYAATGANVSTSGVTAFNGDDSLVLYYNSQSIANIVDAVGFAGNDGADKTFYRISNNAGYNLTAGSSILDFPSVWAGDKTLADVASAAITDEWYLKPYSPPTPPALNTFVLGGGSATTVTGRVSLSYTASGGTAAEYRVSESGDFTGASWQGLTAGLSLDLSAGTGVKTVYFQLQNADGPSAVLSDTIEVVTPAYNPSVLITQYYEPDLAGASNRYLELTNVSAAPVSLSGWTLVRFTNQEAELYKITGATISGTSASISLTDIGTLSPGQTVVVANSSAAVLTPPAALLSSQLNFNGNDSLALYAGAYGTETLVDVIGLTNLGNEGADKSFVRLNNAQGFGLTAGSNVTAFGAVWQEFTLAAVDGAGATANEKLGVYPGSIATGYDDWKAIVNNQPPSEDFDGDGLDNGTEYFMGTAGNQFTPNPGVVGGKVTWPRAEGRMISSFKVEVSTTLTTWEDAALNYSSNLSISPTQVEFTMPEVAGPFFVRLSVVP